MNYCCRALIASLNSSSPQAQTVKDDHTAWRTSNNISNLNMNRRGMMPLARYSIRAVLGTAGVLMSDPQCPRFRVQRSFFGSGFSTKGRLGLRALRLEP